ncbi:hypothetical protein [Cerasicoccus fimbriatus]|uniref:hypothetical protein n=1 Tax=Cerasicoccus fimbriatus TaxID=3014554 RepID=UPI0022B5CC92|nr:hypothetical protein [Cerasicoccus sp. TK19100]
MTAPRIIHCIGDSHVAFFSGSNSTWIENGEDRAWECFRAYHLGPVLAYNLPSTNTTTKGREKLFYLLDNHITPGSWVMTVFGEIDCRAHLLKQAEKKQLPIEDVTAACVQRYFSVVQEIESRDYHVIVYNSIPSLPLHGDEQTGQANCYPVYRSQAERNEAVQAFNFQMCELCSEHGIKFLNTYDKIVDATGRPNGDLYCDEIHLGQKAMPFTFDALKEMFGDWEFDRNAKPNVPLATENKTSYNKHGNAISRMRSKLANVGEAIHPRSLQAIIRGSSSEELKAIRRSLRPVPPTTEAQIRVLSEVCSKYRCKNYVETQCDDGDRLDAFSKTLARCFSIESRMDAYLSACLRFEGVDGATVVHRKVASGMEGILSELTERTLFFLLDNEHSLPEASAPIEYLLSQLCHYSSAGHCIVINHAGRFGRSRNLPSLRVLRKLVQPHFSGWEIRDNLIIITP